MKRILTILIGIAVAAPNFAAADDLDALLDDLILQRESQVRIERARKNDDRRASLNSRIAAFPEIARYNSPKPNRSDESGVVAYQAKYYPERAGTPFEVEFTYSLKRAGVSSFSKMKDLALLFNRSARRDGFTIDGYHAAYINSRGDRAAGIIVALDADTYLTIRAASPVNRQTLSRFAANFSADDLLRLKSSFGI